MGLFQKSLLFFRKPNEYKTKTAGINWFNSEGADQYSEFVIWTLFSAKNPNH